MAAASYSAAWTKSNTFDEMSHLANGFVYWVTHDYRTIPEAILVQRWLALPVYLGGFKPPSFDQQAWQFVKDLEFAQQFLYDVGNDAATMLRLGRAMNLTFAVALGLLVYGWSSSLFGTRGGLLSLTLFAFCPTTLAHGSLVTIDMAAATFFTASTWALWIVLHRLTPVTVALSSLTLACFFVAKLSVVLMIPIGLTMLAVRLIGSKPLEINLFGYQGTINVRLRHLPLFLALIAVHVVVAWLVIWTLFGIRFSIANERTPLGDEATAGWWPNLVQKTGDTGLILDYIHERRLLPEGYLVALAYTAGFTGSSEAFLNGEASRDGWWIFFPYCLLVKTPLPLFILLAFSLIATLLAPPNQSDSVSRFGSLADRSYRASPLFIWLVIYWIFAISSGFNIGHRHILPTYPVMYILAGGAGDWLGRWSAKKRTPSRPWIRPAMGGLTVALLLAFTVESLLTWPNYLAYFNGLIGARRSAYRHLVDSSLDWGQDLPALKRWLDRQGLQQADSARVFLAYFGTARPEYYGIKATVLPHALPGSQLYRGPLGTKWTGGVYCVSATVLQSNGVTSALGRWNQLAEEEYQRLASRVDSIKLGSDEQQAVEQSLTDPASRDQMAEDLRDLWRWDRARLGRLMAYLRQCEPIDQINYSIMIFHLSDDDLQQALFGPPPESTGSLLSVR